MIAADQPSIFGSGVVAAVSSTEDGNMRFGRGDDKATLENRMAFLQKVGVQPEQTTLVQVIYEDAKHFARYRIVTNDHKAEGILKPQSAIIADALVVTQPDHALFLPLADCAGLVVYDPSKAILMVSHVGRHSAEIDGAAKSVAYLKSQLGVAPADLKVWVSPAVGKATYPLRAKDGKSLHEVIDEQLLTAGVTSQNIQICDVNTALHDGYFSHSQFLTGGRDSDGRFAVVAMMTEQGEPAV